MRLMKGSSSQDVLFGLLKEVQKRRQAESLTFSSSKKNAATTGEALKDLQNLIAHN